MKIVVLHGQMHRGSTYHITEQLVNKLLQSKSEVIEFKFPKEEPSYCVGCFKCIMEGEGKCPHSHEIAPIVQAIEEADVVVIESPCYCMGMSGQLKTFMDHMAYRWMVHRPHPKMFHKVGVALSTAAGAGAKKVVKDIKQNMFYWGIPNIYAYGELVNASSWDTVSEDKKKKIDKKIDKLARKIKKKVGHSVPSYQTKAMFYMMRMGQKTNNWNLTDKEHWESLGWIGKKRPW